MLHKWSHGSENNLGPCCHGFKGFGTGGIRFDDSEVLSKAVDIRQVY